MKSLAIRFFSLFNRLCLNAFCGDNKKISGLFFFARAIVQKNNYLKIEHSEVLKTRIIVSGKQNSIISRNAHISHSNISISGTNNHLTIGEGVKLRGSTIIVRGDGCKVEIGSGTTFGGIRIVNVGTNNIISIGEDCLFADQIELWASDTHPIYDTDNKIINKEKPITIGNKVWVGSRVIILKGVNIESGSIIGMGSIVTTNVPASSISVGIPNKTIKSNISWSLHY